MQEKLDLILRDKLAIERTHLANERTFLAYFRTAFVFLVTGLTVLKLDYFLDLKWLGWLFMALFPTVLIFGIIRLFKTKKNVREMY
jgi:putative membrane protein